MMRVAGGLVLMMSGCVCVPQAEDDKVLAELEEMLMAVHYMSLYYQVAAMDGQGELACKIAITLLRYSGVVPTDKLFYIAGMACKQQDHKNLAFILLNRYVPHCVIPPA